MIYFPILVAFVLLFMGVPVGLALLSSALVYFGFITDTLPLTNVVQKMVNSNMSISLLNIPYFIMLGTVMNYTGITNRLMSWCNSLVGHLEGGLAHVNILLSTVNGGMCGSSGADAAMQCKILVPEMVKRGYPLNFAAAVTAASGLIAPMIPPGNLLILYATMTDMSVARMFMAGYIPGIMMCVAEMCVAGYICHKHHYQSRSQRAPLPELLVNTLNASWAILIMAVLIVGLRLGLFNVTEGAVVIILMCVIVGLLVYRDIRIQDIPKMFVESFHSAGNIIIMLMGSLMFGYYLTWAHIPHTIAAAMMTVTSSKYGFMALSMLLMLIMGMFIDGTAMVMIVTPILYPVAQEYGIPLIQFGILELINAYIGSLTPPLGGVMYIVCNLTHLSVPEFSKAAWPFILVLLLVMLVIALVPGCSLLLPSLVYGG